MREGWRCGLFDLYEPGGSSRPVWMLGLSQPDYGLGMPVEGELWDGRDEHRTLGHGPAHWVAPWAVSDASVYPGAG